MDSGADKIYGAILFPLLLGCLLSFIPPSFLLQSAKAAQQTKRFQATYPPHVHAGKPIKIHVQFSSPPPAHVFFQLELTVDDKPVAMADLSEERSTWITAPPQKPGLHHFAVIWRNPPEGTPETIRTDLSILQKK